MPDPKSPKNAPYIVELKAGSYAWCGCGLSRKQPFCDGSHKGTEYEGMKNVPLSFEITEDRHAALCGCKKTSKPPFCDGTHMLTGLV